MGKAAHGCSKRALKMRSRGLALTVLVLLAVALPVTILRLTQLKAHSVRESLTSLANEIHQLEVENGRLSGMLRDFDRLQSGNEEERELLRLRNEVSQLREQTNTMANRHLGRIQQESGVGPGPRHETELSAQTLEAMQNICRELPLAMERFARDHTNQPSSLSELRKYFPLIDGRRMAGLYTFDFVREEGPRAEDLLILGEQGTRETADGKRARVYGFRDGNAVEVRREEDDFEIWEKEHFTSPP